MNYSKCFPGLSSKPVRVSNCEQFPQAIKEVMIMAILFFFHTHISSLLLLFTALDATQARTLIVGGSKNSIKQWGQNISSCILELQILLHLVCQLYTNHKQRNACMQVLSHGLFILFLLFMAWLFLSIVLYFCTIPIGRKVYVPKLAL